MGDGLVLRDIHLATPPPWWPPAPGWWVLGAAVLMVLAALVSWRLLRARRRRRWLALFDREVDAAADAAAAVAAMSALLRRAAKGRHPAADRLEGQAWLDLLDAGRDTPRFNGARGALLLQGPFQRDVDAAAVTDLRHAARERFLEWGEGRR